MKDNDRLALLKDVAGTNVYETRRSDSLRIMDEAEDKKERIKDSLNYIQEQLGQLDEERKELREYHDKEQERRALEYAILYQQSQGIIGKTEELEERRKAETGEAEIKQQRFFDREVEIKKLEDELSALQHSTAVHTADRDALLRERRDLTRARAEVEAAMSDEDDSRARGGETIEELQQRLRDVIQKIGGVEGELMSSTPLYEARVHRLDEKRLVLEQVRTRLEVLLGRQGRGSQYRTVEERNAAIEAQIASLDQFKTQQEASRHEASQELRSIEEEKTAVEKSIEEKSALLEERRTFLQESASKWDELSKKEDELLDRKKGLWKEEHKLASSVAVAKEKLASARKALASMMDRSTASGLSNLESLTQRLGVTGVHGPLYTLFSVDDMYKTAVEVTAGPSMFHVVVDTDETASKLIDVMNKERLGRVTFMPLNRLQPKALDFRDTGDAIAMLKKIQCEARYRKAMQQVFGRTLICPSLNVAASYVKDSGDMNAITLDGDKVERKGAISGGYHDPKRSRLDTARNVKQWSEVYTADDARLQSTRQDTEMIEQQITAIATERGQLETKSKRLYRSREPIQAELRELQAAYVQAAKRLEAVRTSLRLLERDLSGAEVKRGALLEELNLPLSFSLSADETKERDSLQKQLDALEREVAEAASSASEAANNKQLLEIELDNNLRRERDAIEGQVEGLANGSHTEEGAPSLTADVKMQKHRLAGLRAQISDRQKSLEKLERDLEKAQSRTSEIQDSLEAATNEQYNEAKAISRHEKVLSKVLSKRRELEQRKNEVDQKVQELGFVHGDVMQKYMGKDPAHILKKLHAVQAGLQRFSNVNQRAVEQYDGFAKQRDQLLQREADLQRSSESIQELIDTLDMRKDEAIERTFKQVSRNFAEVFEKLVPAGRGQLKMQARHDAETESDEEDSAAMDEGGDGEERAARRTSRIENYVGVSIEVSFHSKEDEGLRIQQLSGGQKSLVALAIVFAIQKCDPAAFYLFDEIDANLDAQYRTAVAAMIQELSAGAQFITTTFRPELVGVGDKHYGGEHVAREAATSIFTSFSPRRI